MTGSLVTCPACRGRGEVERWDNEARDYFWTACPLAEWDECGANVAGGCIRGDVALPVAPGIVWHNEYRAQDYLVDYYTHVGPVKCQECDDTGWQSRVDGRRKRPCDEYDCEHGVRERSRLRDDLRALRGEI